MSWVGNVGEVLGTVGGGLYGGVAAMNATRNGYLGVPGAIVGAFAGGKLGGYLGDRAYELGGGDDEREKALALLNMYLSPEEIQSISSRLPQGYQ